MVAAKPGKGVIVKPKPDPKNPRNVLHIGGVPVEFPYQPYGTQLAFMGRVVSTLDRALREGHCHALLESPTGTGKSLSLLCSTLAWQQNYKAKDQVVNPSQSKAAPEALLDPLNYGGGFVPDAEPLVPGNPEPVQSVPDGKSKKKSIPTIFYSSRTHSQISQVIREYRKTAYRVPMAVLASRKHYCTNSKVRGKENVDEECKMLRRNQVVGCCEFKNANKVKAHPSLQKGGCHEAHDIEDLVKIGQVVRGCSYYAAKSMADDAQLVFCPYSYIINPVVRGAMEVDIEGAIIILDEAHNIEDITRDAGSMDIEEDVLQRLHDELEELCPVNAMIYQPLCEMAQDLMSWMERKKSSLEQRDFQHYVSCWTGDNAMRELQEAHISQQCFPILLDCATKAIKAATDLESEVPYLSGLSVVTLEGLFSALTYFFSQNGDHTFDYQLALQRYIKRDKKQGIGYPIHSFSLWCLNPAVVFRDIAQLSLSVILTSGTLSPTNSFSSELGVQFGTCLEAPHVINVKSQVCGAIVTTGPKNYPLNASYKTAHVYAFQDALGKTLEEIFNIVPGGSLVFFPSYKLMEKLCSRWHETGQWSRLSARKTLFVEPRGQDDFEPVLKGYYDSVRHGNKAVAAKKRRTKRLEHTQSSKVESSGELKKGAAFLAVCRGKVSEGIDFTDDNARAVIIVGIPFPNVNDTQVALKKKYNDTYKSSKDLQSGSEWYCQQAFRALNQAAGRCIRHVLDYGAIIFLDERYREERNRAYISKWLKKSFNLYESFSDSLEGLKSFFRVVREQVGDKTVDMVRGCTDSETSSFIKESRLLARKNDPGDSDCVELEVISDSKPEAAFIQCRGNLESNNLQTAVMGCDRKRDYIDLDCDFEENPRSPAAYNNELCEDPEVSLVKETCDIYCSFAPHARGPLSKDNASPSSVIQSSVDCPDQSSPHSASLSGLSKTHSVTNCSAVITPEREAATGTFGLNSERETLCSSVNSHAQKRRKFISSPLAGTVMDEQSNALNTNKTRLNCSTEKSTTHGDANRRIKFDSESKPADIRKKSSVATLFQITDRVVAAASSCPAVDKRLQISCSLCGAPFGLPESDFYVPSSPTSLSKVHLAKLVEEKIEAGNACMSTGIQVLITDISSVAQQLWDDTSDGYRGQATWCEEDGCVFKTIFCPFCNSPGNCVGVRIMATDASNINLLNKILFFANRLEIKELKSLEDSDTKVVVKSSDQAENDALNSIEKFAYSPKKQNSGGWRTTKSKLRLPRRPLLSDWKE
ncbi:Fanconi anemia group J protein homolog isoform X2 [Rhodamnia argentea]|uniref:Fanconi anemia group J protein homolog isoform X2 n=1 Tax=Rhodamnia argentea TaxID=178133 RepID=A0A8B8P436_9MYRT|nr:Fanconi anemia group J protein homolog isoform X2 [Rhodamnia argentea]